MRRHITGEKGHSYDDLQATDNPCRLEPSGSRVAKKPPSAGAAHAAERLAATYHTNQSCLVPLRAALSAKWVRQYRISRNRQARAMATESYVAHIHGIHLFPGLTCCVHRLRPRHSQSYTWLPTQKASQSAYEITMLSQNGKNCQHQTSEHFISEERLCQP
jgi:hypothetical protein